MRDIGIKRHLRTYIIKYSSHLNFKLILITKIKNDLNAIIDFILKLKYNTTDLPVMVPYIAIFSFYPEMDKQSYYPLKRILLNQFESQAPSLVPHSTFQHFSVVA